MQFQIKLRGSGLNNMDYKSFLLIPLGIALLYYGIFKLKAKKNLYAKIFVLIIASLGGFTIVGDFLFDNRTNLIILIGGLIVMFAVGTAMAWSERKDAEKKVYVYAYLSLMGLLVLCAITILILNKMGFYG